MMNNNKILTVSYGTFSCTLEGFDDSFGTMKAIAEYFRDLAADDRYFGAEPPQPDAEMLARIAQKEISRRVEAREHEGRIVLSAHEERAAVPAALAADAMPEVEVAPQDTPAPEAELPDAPQDVVVDTPVTDDAEEPVVEGAVPDAPEADAEEPEVAQEPQDEEEYASDTASLVSAAMTEEPVAEDTVSNDADADLDETEATSAAIEDAEDEDSPSATDVFTLTEDMAADDDFEDASPEDVVSDLSADAPETDIVPSLPDDEVEAFFSETSQTSADDYEAEEAGEVASPMAAEDVPPARPSRMDSIADKLKRIRAVVSQHRDTDEAPDYTEDEHAEPGTVAEAPSLMADLTDDADNAEADDTTDVMSDALRDLNNALIADDAAEADADGDALRVAHHDDEDLEDENDDVTDILNRLDQADAEDDAQDVAEDETPEADASIFSDTLVSDLIADEASMDDDDNADEDQVEENLFGDDEVAVDEAPADPDEPEDDLADLGATAPRARVIKVKRVELEAAITRGELEEIDDEDATGSSLSDQAEAELARELAELESELDAPQDGYQDVAAADDGEDITDADEIEDALVSDADDMDDDLRADVDDDPHGAARDMLPSIDDDQGSDISRLLAETDSQMIDEESATRRDAFAHLRAAVAAKKADVEAGGADATEEEDGAYRDDLASVVRPRRPASSAGRTARPSTDARPAPLKLVAEQRIDVVQNRPAGPVRPRRVAAVTETAGSAGDTGSFAEFAADMGASKLPELLEAAAAYMSFVEGREQFSRPQLMTKVRQVEQEDFSREDSLRSFGKLLRDGKIEKIKGGRFQVSEQIGFKPDERAAG